MKYDLFNVVYSDVGFRDHRMARYQLKFLLNYKWQTLYFETYKEVLSALKFVHR